MTDKRLPLSSPTPPEMEKIVYEYALLRYVPDIERGEFVNIGLMMMCKRYRWLKVHLNIDQRRISALFPDADIDMLTRQSRVFTADGVPFRDLPVEERYRWLAAVKSAIIQTSPSHPGIIMHQSAEHITDKADNIKDKLEKEFTRLATRLA